MRFIQSNIQEGTARVVTKFLLFPTTIEGETRWLETATIMQEYRRCDYFNGQNCWTWKDIQWVNNDRIQNSNTR